MYILALSILAAAAHGQQLLPGRGSANYPAFLPQHERVASTTVVEGTILETKQNLQAPRIFGTCDSCGLPACGNAGYGRGNWLECRRFRFPRLARAFCNTQFFAGVESFQSPRFFGAPDRGQDGSLGFQQGANWGFPMPLFPRQGITAQAGVRLTQSNFSGTSFTPDDRSQVFLTGGIFRRVDCGLQGGVVFDYLRDEWYVQMDITQLRAELSWVFPACHELGLTVTGGTKGDTSLAVTIVNGNPVASIESWDPVDTYLAFYRFHINDDTGANWRVLGGLSGEKDGLVGFDFMIPMNDRWGFEGGFSYLLQDTNTQFGSISESWSVGFSVVWRPGGFGNADSRYLRPLFNVAGNRSLFLTRQ